jgi:hypothetical protein
MKKLIIVPLMLAALFAISGGASASGPAPAPTDPEFGACRYYCNSGRSFAKLAECNAVCPGECEQIC